MLNLILFLPLINCLSFMLFGFAVPRRQLVLSTIASMSLYIPILASMFSGVCRGETFATSLGVWALSGLFEINWNVAIDALTYTMLIVVLTVSTLVHLYAAEYMREDPHLCRFMSYLSLFTFFMLLLITSDNFIGLFLGWEGVGLCSYLLISFWFTRVQANKAAIKAMVVNRVADLAFTIGVLVIFYVFQTVEFNAVFGLATYFTETTVLFGGTPVAPVTLVAFLLFLGAMGKSAQIGLHTWLPDAMEGPTPVSALIHAATMVTAGVFLIIRCSPLFECASSVLLFVAVVGAGTAFMAATSGLLQNDLKKVIAYSTCSQLGYMVFACGLSGYSLSLFHLSNHAFFKALLFLSAGAVIHAVSSEQDLRRFGGLIRILPYTYSMFLVGSLALMGFPFLTGFYSKDIILEVAAASLSIPGVFAYWLGIVTAFFTAFYSFRLLYLAFYGTSRSPRGYLLHAHELPITMAIPLAVLSFGSIFVGYLAKDLFIGFGAPFWNGAVYHSPAFGGAQLDGEFLSFVTKMTPLFGSMVSVAGVFFINTLPDRSSNYQRWGIARTLHRFLSNKWYFDTVYNRFINRPLLVGGYRVTFASLDKGLLELFGPTGLSRASHLLGRELTALQSGRVQDYAGAIIFALTTWALLDFPSEGAVGAVLSGTPFRRGLANLAARAKAFIFKYREAIAALVIFTLLLVLLFGHWGYLLSTLQWILNVLNKPREEANSDTPPVPPTDPATGPTPGQAKSDDMPLSESGDRDEAAPSWGTADNSDSSGSAPEANEQVETGSAPVSSIPFSDLASSVSWYDALLYEKDKLSRSDNQIDRDTSSPGCPREPEASAPKQNLGESTGAAPVAASSTDDAVTVMESLSSDDEDPYPSHSDPAKWLELAKQMEHARRRPARGEETMDRSHTPNFSDPRTLEAVVHLYARGRFTPPLKDDPEVDGPVLRPSAQQLAGDTRYIDSPPKPYKSVPHFGPKGTKPTLGLPPVPGKRWVPVAAPAKGLDIPVLLPEVIGAEPKAVNISAASLATSLMGPAVASSSSAAVSRKGRSTGAVSSSSPSSPVRTFDSLESSTVSSKSRTGAVSSPSVSSPAVSSPKPNASTEGMPTPRRGPFTAEDDATFSRSLDVDGPIDTGAANISESPAPENLNSFGGVEDSSAVAVSIDTVMSNDEDASEPMPEDSGYSSDVENFGVSEDSASPAVPASSADPVAPAVPASSVNPVAPAEPGLVTLSLNVNESGEVAVSVRHTVITGPPVTLVLQADRPPTSGATLPLPAERIIITVPNLPPTPPGLVADRPPSTMADNFDVLNRHSSASLDSSSLPPQASTAAKERPAGRPSRRRNNSGARSSSDSSEILEDTLLIPQGIRIPGIKEEGSDEEKSSEEEDKKRK